MPSRLRALVSGLAERLRRGLEERRRAELLTEEERARLAKHLPELRRQSRATVSYVADIITLRLAKRYGVVLGEREARRLAERVRREPAALRDIVERLEAERRRRKVESLRRRAAEREAAARLARLREAERRIAAVAAALSSAPALPALSLPWEEGGRRRRSGGGRRRSRRRR